MIETLIQKYGIEPFEQIDAKITKKKITGHFMEKFGKPYSLVSLALVLSLEKRPIEIDEMIGDISGKPSSYFASVTFSKLKRTFPMETFPERQKKARPSKLLEMKPRPKKYLCKSSHHKVRNPKGKLYAGICIECLKHYECDIEENPANLCVCLKCSPKGVSYGEFRSQTQSTFAQAGNSNPQKGAQI